MLMQHMEIISTNKFTLTLQVVHNFSWLVESIW